MAIKVTKLNPSESRPFIPDIDDNRESDDPCVFFVEGVTDEEHRKIQAEIMGPLARKAKARDIGKTTTEAVTRLQDHIFERKISRIVGLESDQGPIEDGKTFVRLLPQFPSSIAEALRNQIYEAIVSDSRAEEGFLAGSHWRHGSASAAGDPPSDGNV